MAKPTLEMLASDAGLDGAQAAALQNENVSVDVLISSTLPERREVLRAMGFSFGMLLAVNRVLERYRKQRLDDDADNDYVVDDDVEDEDCSGDDEDQEDDTLREDDTTPDAAPAEKRPPVQVVTSAIPVPVSASLAAQLQAAALLLSGAEPHTLKALHTYLGNVLLHPTQSSFRTVQLSNPLFHERVWGVPGGASILRAAGFAEARMPGQPAVLHLPMSAPLDPARAAKHVVDLMMEGAGIGPSSPARGPSPPKPRKGPLKSTQVKSRSLSPVCGSAGSVSTSASTSAPPPAVAANGAAETSAATSRERHVEMESGRAGSLAAGADERHGRTTETIAARVQGPGVQGAGVQGAGVRSVGVHGPGAESMRAQGGHGPQNQLSGSLGSARYS